LNISIIRNPFHCSIYMKRTRLPSRSTEAGRHVVVIIIVRGKKNTMVHVLGLFLLFSFPMVTRIERRGTISDS